MKCVTVGEYSHTSHTVVFPDTKSPERTNDGFRNKIYGAHHKMDTPLLSLPIDMVTNFPVGDSLHLIDLGIMKRLLIGWRDGNFGKYITKWRASDTENVSNFLNRCILPSEIHRSVRGLDCLAYWKASEFRSFFFYLSIVILPDVLPPNAFSHFLALYCGITICANKAYLHLLPLAEQLIRYFVEHYKDFYGAAYVTSNVHNLLHVTAEVEMYGTLDTFSAYPFENKLYMIKKMLRGGKNPLPQVAKRLTEDDDNSGMIDRLKKKYRTKYPYLSKSTKNICTLNFRDFILSSKRRDSYFLTVSDEIVEIISIEVFNDISIKGLQLNDKEDVFVYPLKSSRFGIFKSKSLKNCDTTEVVLNSTDIKCKLVCHSHKDYHFFIPLGHTI